MGFDDLKESQRQSEEKAQAERRAQDGRFRRRLRGQRFLRDFAPLLAASAVLDDSPLGPSFEARVVETNELARTMAQTFLGDGFKAEHAFAYRRQAAEIVAGAWRDGRTIDVPTYAERLARAQATSEAPETDVQMLGSDASEFVTSIHVRAAIVDVVSVYDFRLGVARVSRTLFGAIASRSASLSRSLDGDEGLSETDRRTMVQTATKAFADTMCATYLRAAKSAVSRFIPLTESERIAALDVERPVEAIVARFHELAASYESRAGAEMDIEAPAPATPEVLDHGMHDRTVPALG